MYERVQKIFIAWAFNRYIAKDYFDNVNVNQLEVAIEKGEVELENLPIKQDALHHFDLPIDVISGIVGKLTIKVPLLTFSSDPWSIKITNLTLNVARNGADSQGQGNTTLDENDSLNLNNSHHFGTDSNEPDGFIDNPEGTKLAEFVSSLTATLSSMVKDIYKNIRLEVDSMTVKFNDTDHGLVKFSFDNLLLHRPRSDRNLIITNLTLFLSSNVNRPISDESNDLTRVRIDQCNLDITDESSNNMQLVILQKQQNQDKSKENVEEDGVPSTTCSEIRCEGNLVNVHIDELMNDDKDGGEFISSLNKTTTDNLNDTLNFQEPRYQAKRTILDCDRIKIQFKLLRNVEEVSSSITEKNLQMKFDLIGMRYTHSQRIYEVTLSRLKNLRHYVMEMVDGNRKRMKYRNEKVITSVKDKQKLTTGNKLLIINILDGIVYVVDDTPSSCAIPTLEITLDDFRYLQFSGKNQQNGFVFAKVGCNYFNRESSYWDVFLHPWSFNLSWDFKSDNSTLANKVRKTQQRQISLSSDELADFVISNAFIDICDVSLKKIFLDFINPNNWLSRPNMNHDLRISSQGFSSIFVLNNESGHRLYFAPMEQNSDLYEIHDPSKSLIVSGGSGDYVNNTVIHKSSTTSRSSATSSRDSPELRSTRWIVVQPGESIPFEYETLPIYRRYVNDRCAQAKKRVILIRIDGWKTLVPVVIDQTGTFYREALSDRVCYEDTHIAISIDLEGSTARKIVSVRSPLKLVNSLNVTLEVHFFESNQAFYIKPDHHLAVPLPYLYNTIRIRPWNVGVTTSEQSISWDDIKWSAGRVSSRMFVCNPITVTNIKHASYCTSRSYRICVSIQQDKNGLEMETESNKAITAVATTPLNINGANNFAYNPLPIYTLTFIAPLTIVNLLPYPIQYIIGDLSGELTMGNEQIVNYVDTTKPNDLFFIFDDMHSKPINIDPGATGSFSHIVEMMDEKRRSLYLKAKIILSSVGEEPAVRVIIYAQYWFLNKTGLPLIFKQEGASLDAAGQFSKHEERVKPILLFSFYDSELEPPWLCSMRLGMSQGASSWCEGFKLEKGNGERRINYVSKGLTMKHLIDINVRKGFGRYVETTIVTFNVRHGFDPTTKTPKKAPIESPHNYKLTSYNHNTNLADRFAGQAGSLFNNVQQKNSQWDVNLVLPGVKIALVGKDNEKLVDTTAKEIVLKCYTKLKDQLLDLSVQDIRIENALVDCENSVMLDRIPQLNRHKNPEPALRLIMDRVISNSFGATLFRQVQLSTCELMLNIEEKLLLKLIELISFRYTRPQRRAKKNTLAHDLRKNLEPDEDRKSRYYFDLLKIHLASLQLSVFSSPNIAESLQNLRTYLGLKFFSFEDAKLELKPYFKMNVSKTFKGVFDSVTRFYKKQILDQAPRIVGQQIQNYLRFHLSDLLSTLYDEVYNKLMIL